MKGRAWQISAAIRIAYGAFFFAIGVYGGQAKLRDQPSPFVEDVPAAAEFQAALDETGFIVPIMLICYCLGGILLFDKKTTPLGLCFLAPFVVVIFFYHLLLKGNFVWGSIWLIGWALLAVQHRAAFLALISHEK